VLASEACSDYKGVTGLCEDRVSRLQLRTPYGLYACDSCLGDSNADGHPEVLISRVPAASSAQLGAYVDKFAAYEANRPSERKVLLVSDHADDAGDFGADSSGLAEQLADGSQTNCRGRRELYPKSGSCSARRGESIRPVNAFRATEVAPTQSAQSIDLTRLSMRTAVVSPRLP
jgi:hypothetical protein